MPKTSQGLSDKRVSTAQPKAKDYKLYDREDLCILEGILRKCRNLLSSTDRPTIAPAMLPAVTAASNSEFEAGLYSRISWLPTNEKIPAEKPGFLRAFYNLAVVRPVRAGRIWLFGFVVIFAAGAGGV